MTELRDAIFHPSKVSEQCCGGPGMDWWGARPLKEEELS